MVEPQEAPLWTIHIKCSGNTCTRVSQDNSKSVNSIIILKVNSYLNSKHNSLLMEHYSTLSRAYLLVVGGIGAWHNDLSIIRQGLLSTTNMASHILLLWGRFCCGAITVFPPKGVPGCPPPPLCLPNSLWCGQWNALPFWCGHILLAPPFMSALGETLGHNGHS